MSTQASHILLVMGYSAGNKFSSMPIDQVHEQDNKRVKGSGGAIGLIDKSGCPLEVNGSRARASKTLE